MEPDIAVPAANPEGFREPGADTILLYGVQYDLALFRALARRLGQGTRCELLRLTDGTLTMYTHRPGARPAPPGR